MENYQKEEVKKFLNKYRICEECNGDGWTSEHANHPHENGCDGCPVQVECDWCEGLGFVVIDKAFKKVVNNIKSDDIPF